LETLRELARFRVQPILSAQHAKVHQRVVRWHNVRDRRRSEDEMAQRVLDVVGPNTIVACANGSGWHALPGTPVVGPDMPDHDVLAAEREARPTTPTPIDPSPPVVTDPGI
jgi:hypothetical protein